MRPASLLVYCASPRNHSGVCCRFYYAESSSFLLECARTGCLANARGLQHQPSSLRGNCGTANLPATSALVRPSSRVSSFDAPSPGAMGADAICACSWTRSRRALDAHGSCCLQATSQRVAASRLHKNANLHRVLECTFPLSLIVAAIESCIRNRSTPRLLTHEHSVSARCPAEGSRCRHP